MEDTKKLLLPTLFRAGTIFVSFIVITSSYASYELLSINILHGLATMYLVYHTLTSRFNNLNSLLLEMITSNVYLFRMYEMPASNNSAYTMSYYLSVYILITNVLGLVGLTFGFGVELFSKKS